jgi:AraC-like DNA-binding protein
VDKVSRTKRPYATEKIRNIAAIPATLMKLGADPDEVVRRAGLHPNVFADPENIIPFAALGRLISEAVKATGREDFGLCVGAANKASVMGLTGLVSVDAPTVRDALQVVIETLGTSDTGGATFLRVRDHLASFGYAVTAPDIESADQIVDGALAIAFNLMRQLCGLSWRPSFVRLTRAPPRDKTPFRKFFGSPVDFDQSSACLVFDAGTLDQPVSGRDPEYAKILAPLLDEAVANAREDFITAIRSAIRAQIGAGSLSRESLCRALGMNARTLAHRLAAHGVTYSGLADEARYAAAQSLLRREKPIAEIAVALGSAEQSAFTRAFKSWSGTTPARWRAER